MDEEENSSDDEDFKTVRRRNSAPANKPAAQMLDQ